jgi:hypothetical protein
LLEMVVPAARLPETQMQALEGVKALQQLLEHNRPQDLSALPSPESAVQQLGLQFAEANPGRQIGFRFSRYRSIACDPRCDCACHRKVRRCSPRLLHWIVGQIFWASSGLPYRKTSCDNDAACNSPPFQPMSPTTFHLGYFPGCFCSQCLPRRQGVRRPASTFEILFLTKLLSLVISRLAT